MGTVKQWSLCFHWVYSIWREAISKYKIDCDKCYIEKESRVKRHDGYEDAREISLGPEWTSGEWNEYLDEKHSRQRVLYWVCEKGTHLPVEEQQWSWNGWSR